MEWEGQGEMGSGFCMEGVMMILVNGVVNARESALLMEKSESLSVDRTYTDNTVFIARRRVLSLWNPPIHIILT